MITKSRHLLHPFGFSDLIHSLGEFLEINGLFPIQNIKSFDSKNQTV